MANADHEETKKSHVVQENDRVKRGKAFELNSKPRKTASQSIIVDPSNNVATAEDLEKFRLASTDPSSRGLWEQAWERVKVEDDDWESWPQLQGIKNRKTIDVVHEVHNFAQNRRDQADGNQGRFPGTTRTYRKMCSKVARCAKKFEIVGDLVVQAEPVYAALPWTLLRFVIECTVGESETWESMHEETENVVTHITNYSVIEQLYASIDSKLSHALRDSLLIFYTLMLRFQFHLIKYFDPARKGRRTLEGMNPVTADRNKKEIQAIEDARHHVDDNILLVDAEVTKLGIDNLKEGQEGQKDRLVAVKEGIKALSKDLEEGFSEAEQHQRERHEELVEMWKGSLDDLKTNAERERVQLELDYTAAVRQWLAEANPWEDHEKASSQRRMGLGTWLTQEETFKKWHNSNESSMLWLYGFAGTGKTGLVCRIIEDSIKQDATKDSSRLAIFYCSNDNAKSGRGSRFSRADPEEALRSLISQLSTMGGQVASVVAHKYETQGPNSDRPKTLDYLDCVEILIEISRTTAVTIVLDAFDECDQDKSSDLLHYLESVVRQATHNVKIFISTRPFPAIEKTLNKGPSIEVTKERNGDDVHEFIKTTLDNKRPELLEKQAGLALRKHIVDTLTARAGNMFLYASLLLNQLCDERYINDEESIRTKLDELPKTLTEIYDRIMQEIHDEKTNSPRSCRIAQSTIKWLLSTQKSMDDATLLEAISPPEYRIDLNEVRRACRTLIVAEGGSINFAHYSIREHVMRMEEYTPSRCNIVATQSCLRILTTFLGANQPIRSGLSASQLTFKDYALLYWPVHYEGITYADLAEHRTTMNAMLRSLFLKSRGNRNVYQDWYQSAVQMTEPSTKDKYLRSKLDAIRADPPTPLFAACVFGLEDLIGKFGRELHGLDRSNVYGQNVLCLAVENNKPDAVKALLSGRFPADINSVNLQAVQQFIKWDAANPQTPVLYASALQCAAATGNLEIAELLIKEGAHIDLVAGFYGSPLQAACLGGHLAIVGLLLREGAEPNSQGGFHGNALQAAAARGHSDVVDLLIENKPPALVDCPGGHYGSALMAAVCSSSNDTVLTLLEEKAEPSISTRFGDYGTALEQAVRIGSESKDIVDTLVDFKAKADLSPTGIKVHILHRAAMFGMNGLVKYCLDQGCQIDMITTEGPDYDKKNRFNWFPRQMTPLAFACAEGHLDVVLTLLEHKAPFEDDRPHSAPLWVAAYQGHAAIADLLIRKFKDHHSKEEVLSYMDHLPHPDAGRHFLLFTAASSGNADVVKVLLDHGVPYRSNWFGATPLQATVTFGCSATTKVMLDYQSMRKVNLGIDQQTKDKKTPLYDACIRNQVEIASLLLDAGANMFIVNDQNSTTLHEACRHENYTLVKKLLEKAVERAQDDGEFLTYLNTRHGTTGNTPLMECAERNRHSFLNLLLDHGADPLICNNAIENSLHLACRHDNYNLVEDIILKVSERTNQAGLLAFINQQPGHHQTALLKCAENGRLEALNLLLAHGADYTLHGHWGNTPLIWACIKGHHEIVSVLVRRAKDPGEAIWPFEQYVNRRNQDNRSALFEAIVGNHQRIVALLLEEGADWFVISKTGTTPLHAGVWSGHREVAVMLLEKASATAAQEQFSRFLETRNSQGKTALFDACERGWTEIFKVLVDKYGADYLLKDNNAVSVLNVCCWSGNLETLRYLLNVAINQQSRECFIAFVNHRNKWGESALADAAQKGRTDYIDLLLHAPYNADYRIGNNDNVTPLHRACRNAHRDTVALLLRFSHENSTTKDFQLFINGRDKWGKTPLMVAAEFNRLNIIGQLLDYSADYSILDNEDFTALHYCAFRNHLATVRVLLERTSQDKSDNGNRFRKFLNQQGKRNRATALRDATLQRHTEVAKYLLSHGPVYDLLDSGHRSALHQALGTGNEELAIALVDYARKDTNRENFRRFLNEKDENGDSPWPGATRRKMVVLVERLRMTGMV